MKYVNTNIVFREVPDEVTLAINISNCPNRCEGCHSPYLRQNIGEELTDWKLQTIIDPYRGLITCVCFMGGDASPDEVADSATFVKRHYVGKILTAWYSGREDFPPQFRRDSFDFVKLGPYIPAFGPLDKRTTNQRLFRLHPDGRDEDVTAGYWNVSWQKVEEK